MSLTDALSISADHYRQGCRAGCVSQAKYMDVCTPEGRMLEAVTLLPLTYTAHRVVANPTSDTSSSSAVPELVPDTTRLHAISPWQHKHADTVALAVMHRQA